MTESSSPTPGGEHSPNLAHHFDTYRQQFEAGKLGMWLFLLTEILLFGGLFCAYAVYRANHPYIFHLGVTFLDTTLGAVNTCVLLFSSLTMAWGVHCAQCDQRRGLIVCLVLTLLCAFAFLGIKYVEYEHKWHDGLLWARQFRPDQEAERQEAEQGDALEGTGFERGTVPFSPRENRDSPQAASLRVLSEEETALMKRRVGVFFSIYFGMTGLHALHVVAGMVAITWILVRSVKGHFGSGYFGPVDYVGLYWHLVDMIWIYLFPLLYLID